MSAIIKSTVEISVSPMTFHWRRG